ncbi:sulfate transporter N-terminal domain with GLY motif-domain-containing protein [Mycena epipterygia]|nr:sulfate transporter N-terminal domain with GLY motif-domain-containing protein [Mycena epipterygia]
MFPGPPGFPIIRYLCLGGDALAGLTVASMLIPQSVSYATSLAQMSPLTGLFSASIHGALYAFLGTCHQLNVGPEAAISLLVGQGIARREIYFLPGRHYENRALSSRSSGVSVNE